MWFTKNKKLIIVTVSFTDSELICSALQDTHELIAYQKYILEHSELYNLMLFNNSLVADYIQRFLSTYNLTKALTVFSLDGPGLHEFLVQEITEEISAHKNTLYMQQQAINFQEHSFFYVAGIEYYKLLQYQLLAASLRIQLIALVPQLSAYINLAYRYKIKKLSLTNLSKLKKSLVLTLEENYFSDSNQELAVPKQDILIAASLYTLGKNIYETT